MNTQQYFKDLEKNVRKVYEVAEEARKKGLDPVEKVEIPLAMTMAEKVVGLISTIYPQMEGTGIAKRILELEKQWSKLDPAVSLKIAEEIAKQKFCKFASLLEAIDAGVRVGFAYITLGVVSSPIEGLTEIKLVKTKEGKDCFGLYYSGPVRSAGGTGSAFSLVIADHLREVFGYAVFDPSEEEIKRTVTEINDFHERITNLQYMPTDEEIVYLVKHIPIQIAGEPSEKIEVSNYKNLPRIPTNFLRSGFCLVFSEGIAQKAAKIQRYVVALRKKGFKLSAWDFLEGFIELHKKRDTGKTDDSPTYIKDLVAGRPVFGHPSRSGAFRFRYGRGRNNGFSAASVHPATMAISDGFIAIGTQMKIEKPTKGCAVTSCDSIDGPIVKLFSGSVRKLKSKDEAKKLYPDVEEIIYLGDLLLPFSDLSNRNSDLIKPGYVEEWWKLDLREKDKEAEKKINCFEVDFAQSVELSRKFKIPLNPKFIFYWKELENEQFSGLIDWLKYSKVIDKKLIFPFNQSEQERFKKGKRALELLGVEHEVTIENVVLNEQNSKSLLANIGVDFEIIDIPACTLIKDVLNESRFDLKDKKVFEIINSVSEFEIKDKSGDFIGARMGRPEKAKLRKLAGSPNVLFPVGNEGGRLRSFQTACEVGNVKSSFPINYCEECKKETIYSVCEDCGKKCKKMYYCYECKERFMEPCKTHEKKQTYCHQSIDINHYLNDAVKKLNFTKNEIPLLIKGIRGTSSTEHKIEHLEKGILRALYDLQVNKDGTIRLDATELPLVSFKPKEISVGVEKLKELGYTEDIYGKELVDNEQILELMPHDVILPSSPESPDERADEVFIKVSNFVDDLLEKFYGMKPFYNVNSREDLVGKLGVCMAPHNCAGVICRFIGFSNTLGLFASPYMHAAIRRDCVHPETNFVYSEKERIYNEGIGKYVENLINQGAKTKKIDSYGTIRVDIDKKLYAFGVDPTTKKLKKKKIKYFIKGAPPEMWVKMSTCSGREQIMTPRHKFIYLDDKNNFKIKRASEIKKGDRLALLKDFSLNKETDEIFLPKLLSEKVPVNKQNEIRIVGVDSFFRKLVEKLGENKIRNMLNLDNSFNNLYDWYNLVPLNHVNKFVEEGLIKWKDIPNTAKIRTIFNNKKWNLRLNINEDLMNVLGYYSAEGYSRQTKTVSQVCFRIMDKNQRKKLVSAINEVFGLKANLGEEETKITICNKLVYYLFRYCFNAGSSAYEKKVPNIVFSVSDKLVENYLSCYFDGDGTIINNHNAKKICFYSVSKKLLDGISLLGCRFGMFGRFTKTNKRLPGKKVLERYKQLGKSPKRHILHHLVYSGRDFYKIVQMLNPMNKRKLGLIKSIKLKEARERQIKYENKLLPLEKLGNIFIDRVKKVENIKEKKPSYCFDVESENEEDKNVLWGEQIINFRCDGDEAAIMLLGDVLLNFSRKFLPSHRGGTQDAPLVLNAKIDAGEVDDQILDFEFVNEYPLELYRLAEQRKHSSEIKIKNVKSILKNNENPFINVGFTHNTDNFNDGVVCSSYKLLPTMREKVQHQMEFVERVRAVDTSDTARLILERHFIKDMRGNLRKFSMQEFRCVGCNEIMRRPPLNGVCVKCKGKIIFTIHEGGIKKYLEPALELAKKYNLSPYMQQSLELVKRYVDSIFGKELEKQEGLGKWF